MCLRASCCADISCVLASVCACVQARARASARACECACACFCVASTPTLLCSHCLPCLPHLGTTSAHDAYSLSKLADIVFTLKLDQQLRQAASNVTVRHLHSRACTQRALQRVHAVHSCISQRNSSSVAVRAHASKRPSVQPGACQRGRSGPAPSSALLADAYVPASQAVTLDPGTVNTKMLLAGWGRIGIEVGQADNTFRLLADADVAADSGAYFVGHRQTRCGLVHVFV